MTAAGQIACGISLVWLVLGCGGCSPAAQHHSGKPAASNSEQLTEGGAATEVSAHQVAADASDTAADDGLTDLADDGAVDLPAAGSDLVAANRTAAGSGQAEAANLGSAQPNGTAGGRQVLLGSPELTAGIPGSGPVTLEEIRVWLAKEGVHEALVPVLPVGLAEGAANVKIPADNPLTLAKIELGRQLYFDPRLSADGTISCASCHHPDEGFTRNTQFGVGIDGQQGGRNSPVSYNRILSDRQFWDGRAESLEAQAVGPIANPIEMGNTHAAAVAAIAAVPGYKLQFEEIFGAVTIGHVGQALAAFERTLVTGPAPYDHFALLEKFKGQDEDDLKADPELWASYQAAQVAAQAHPMTEAAVRGRDLFFSAKANCSTCHVGANFTDEKFHNLGVGMAADQPDIGREEVTKDQRDRGAFKTPTLRNVALTAPYMHDGSLVMLADVMEWYAKGGQPNPHLSDKIKKLDLSEQDKVDLVAFMQSLTGDFPPVATDRLPE